MSKKIQIKCIKINRNFLKLFYWSLYDLLFFIAVVQTLDKRNNLEEFILAHSSRVQSIIMVERAQLVVCEDTAHIVPAVNEQRDKRWCSIRFFLSVCLLFW